MVFFLHISQKRGWKYLWVRNMYICVRTSKAFISAFNGCTIASSQFAVCLPCLISMYVSTRQFLQKDFVKFITFLMAIYNIIYTFLALFRDRVSRELILLYNNHIYKYFRVTGLVRIFFFAKTNSQNHTRNKIVSECLFS